ncbi:ATP-binding protein [Flavimobilis marinus]|uniref:ATP-binding protein n=1 Tax=Flavimobilis marinus TaxID=285351 RepID=A0A1I2DFR0_9MICO|nr:DUF3107 domain-containing protein [Flavimobilis marinus]GHG45274.1 ATP-binding protein [Flavimobilis marinus]SFE79334.1 Protein of unknown function [Flavimobilis marinus]
MEITIGVQNLPRELVVETEQDAAEVTAQVTAAIEGKTVLTLTDTRGRQVIVPTATIGYVEISSADQRKVGFGAI